MTGKKTTGFYLDMPFDEALERYAGVPLAEVEQGIARAKAKKAPGAKKQPTGGKSKSEEVISFKDRKVRKRRTGHA